MAPRSMMIFGFVLLVLAVVAEVIGAKIGSMAVFSFAAGALFGKGYGVWEERTRRPARPVGED